MPGLWQNWPEGSFYKFDEIYGGARLDYRGPTFGWWDMTDQFVLARATGGTSVYRFVHNEYLQVLAELGLVGGILLEALDKPAAYVAVDISREQLRQSAARLAADFPKLAVVAVCADYTRPFELPPLPGPDGKRVGFFPGSTIGNFEPQQVVAFLADWAALLGAGGEMLIGVDLKKDPKILNAAYNDKAGINAAFNLNLLTRINRELGGDFDIDRFAHVAFYNEAEGRVELYLKSLAEQSVTIAGQRFRFAAGELIHTENSYKYAIDEFRGLAAVAGFEAIHTWTDRHQLFSVHYLRRG